MRLRTIRDLQDALIFAGLPHNKKTLRRWEETGKLISPRSTTNKKKINNNWYYVRVFTQQQLNSIVKAFLPGGPGEWKP